MAGLTRHELKKDELRTTVEHLEQFFRQRSKEIATGVGIAVVVVGLTMGLRTYMERQEYRASTQLGNALRTFRAYVGQAAPNTLGPGQDSFSTAQEKYKRALEQFKEIARRFPHTNAGAIAHYHAGICESQLGDQASAIRSFQEATHASDRNIAALAEFAYAGELAKGDKTDQAAKLYQELADHPTLTVPKATALLAMADAYRASRPAQARQLYERVGKEFSSDTSIQTYLKQQVAGLPK